MNIEEQLYDMSADLLSERQFLPFVERLFAEEPGAWSTVASLCNGISLAEDRIRSLCDQLEGNLVVTWLEYVGGPYGPGFASVIFFEDQLLWSSIAVYNKNLI